MKNFSNFGDYRKKMLDKYEKEVNQNLPIFIGKTQLEKIRAAQRRVIDKRWFRIISKLGENHVSTD